nr:MAG TPA: Protein of unknown function (DUF1492) [Caudoviricetes sp.]
MTYEEKKDWLRRYERAKKKELHLTHELQEAECDYGHMTQALSSVPGGSGDGQALPRAVERVEKAKQALDAQILFCDDLHAEITAVLLSLEDPDDYEILKLRYLHFKTWESIAAEIKLCLRQIYRRHRRAIDELNL